MKIKVVEIEATAKELNVDKSLRGSIIDLANSLSKVLVGIDCDDEEDTESDGDGE